MKYRSIFNCDILVFDGGEWGIIKCKEVKGESDLIIVHRAMRCEVCHNNGEASYIDPIRHNKEFKCPCGAKVPDDIKGLWYLGSFDHIAKEK